MTTAVPADQIERLVGARRHATAHLGRDDTKNETVYVLHSEECRASTLDLRTCPYSLALDRGIDRSFSLLSGRARSGWALCRNVVVALDVRDGELVPLMFGPDDAELLGPREEENSPLSSEYLFADAETVGGVQLLQIGEDGDWILAPGHDLTPDAMAAALTTLYGDEHDPDDIHREWWRARPHRDGCHDHLDLGDTCQCDDYGWWASQVTQDTPGAIAVTVWSA